MWLCVGQWVCQVVDSQSDRASERASLFKQPGDSVAEVGAAAEAFYGHAPVPEAVHGPTGAREATTSRAEHVIGFFSDSLSPVRLALEDSTALLDPNLFAKTWAVCRRFSCNEEALLKQIWETVFPMASTIWWLVEIKVRQAFPYKLVLLASDREAERKKVADEFAALEMCCCPRGIRAWRQSIASADTCLQHESQVLARELAAQLDLSIFDTEVIHGHRASKRQPPFCHTPTIATIQPATRAHLLHSRLSFVDVQTELVHHWH